MGVSANNINNQAELQTLEAKLANIQAEGANEEQIATVSQSIDEILAKIAQNEDLSITADNFSEVIGNLIEPEDNSAAITGVNEDSDDYKVLEKLFEDINSIEDPEMQEIFNQQIIDASESMKSRGQYEANKDSSEEEGRALNVSL